MRELIGWTCGVLAGLAVIGLAYGIVVWRFGDACPCGECPR